MSRKSPCRPGPMRRGMTLLEVLLALLVLVVALSGITALIFNGRASAADAQDLTQAQLLCEAKLNSIVAGIDAAESSRGVFRENPEFTFEVQTSNPGTPGLLSVRVKVSQNPAQFDNPIEFTLVRWMPDPNFASETAQ